MYACTIITSYGYSPTLPGVDIIAVLVLDTPGVETGGIASDVETWESRFVEGHFKILIYHRT